LEANIKLTYINLRLSNNYLRKVSLFNQLDIDKIMVALKNQKSATCMVTILYDHNAPTS
jgi:hypothetical protein